MNPRPTHLALLLALVHVPAASAEPPSSLFPTSAERAAVAAAVDRALLFLARQQRPDGAFADGKYHLALTALATLSFLSAGHPDVDGKYGGVVSRAADLLAAAVPKDGYVGKVDGSRMYGQAIITIALAELIGNTPDEPRRARLLAALRNTVPVILAAQNISKGAEHAGGWRYEPTSTDSDLSLSGWCAQALRAARGVEIDVPNDALTRAMNYVLTCRTPSGGFAYQAGGNPDTGPTAAGSLTLLLLSPLSVPALPELAPALEFLASRPVKFEDRFAYYTVHLALAAAHHAGPAFSPRVTTWAVPLLLSLQQPDGGFPQSRSAEEPGRIYATSLATLALSLPTSPMPSHQR